MAIFGKLENFRNTGLLLMRIGLGVMMITHGYPKLMGGPEKWLKIGRAVEYFSIHSYHTAWGFAAAVAEGIGGLMLILGLFFRPTSILLMGTMVVAATKHLAQGDGLSGASHAIELAFVFLGLIFLGPGRYSVDKS